MSGVNEALADMGGLFEKTRKCVPIQNDSGSIFIHYWADSGRMEPAIAASFSGPMHCNVQDARTPCEP